MNRRVFVQSHAFRLEPTAGANRFESLPWYASILPAARETARRQGYDGARWENLKPML